ncbi:transposase [Methylobacterium sp. SD274]|nr:transposase [Methylobacterium sp. SD274]
MHSRYHRRPADLPTSGHEMRLTLTIRRFYCHDAACARRTFAERLPRLLDRYAQRTRRLANAQVRTALALGATPIARLLPHLAILTCATTLLRGIRKWPLPTGSKPIIVGVDDWALRKGRTYGTILRDLKRRRPIDLLPDRSASTLAARLRRDPQIQVVARDRSTKYARGTAMGAQYPV